MHFAKLISGFDNVFSVDVLMNLHVLKFVSDGQLYHFTGIVNTVIDDNVVINENIQK